MEMERHFLVCIFKFIQFYHLSILNINIGSEDAQTEFEKC